MVLTHISHAEHADALAEFCIQREFEVCCSILLQCVMAVCCIVLQCIGVCCSMGWRIAELCIQFGSEMCCTILLQCVTLFGSVLHFSLRCVVAWCFGSCWTLEGKNQTDSKQYNTKLLAWVLVCLGSMVLQCVLSV